MNLNVIDEETIRVSDNVHYEVTKLGTHHIITVDNVLENPQYFIDNIVEKLPLKPNNRHPDVVFPGPTGKFPIQLPELDYLVGYILQKCTDFTDIDPKNVESFYQLNAIYSDVEVKRASIQPHVDTALYATVLYLNPDEDMKGGTSFFSHSSTGLTNMEHIHKPFKRTEEYWNLKEWTYDFMKKSEEKIDCDSLLMEDVWEEEHHIKMKYNRMIIFPSYMWHSAIIKKGWYKDKPRVSLSGFVPPSNLGVE